MRKLQNNEVLIHPHDHKNLKDWQRIFNLLDKNLNIREINSFLELGAGMGNLSRFILKKNPLCQMVCEDINQDYLKIIQEKEPRIQTLFHDINQALPFKTNSFDLVACIGTLHYFYVKNSEKVLTEIRRVSKKYIFIDCFSRYSPWVFYEKIFHPQYNPRRKSFIEMKKVFQRQSLKILDIWGTRTIFPQAFPFSGKLVVFLLKKQ